MSKKVYIDTNIISRVVDGRIPDDQAIALGEISTPQICGANRFIQFVSSRMLFEEVSKTSNLRKRSLLVFLTALVDRTEWVTPHDLIPPILGAQILGEGVMGGSVNRPKPSFNVLRNIFDSADASHIFQAGSNGCEIFLTLDERTIIARANSESKVLKTAGINLTFLKPLDLAVQLREAGIL